MVGHHDTLQIGKEMLSSKKLHCWHQKKKKKLIFMFEQVFLPLRRFDEYIMLGGWEEIQTGTENLYVQIFLVLP